MWKTCSEGTILDDKISNNLRDDLKLEWAQVVLKPEGLSERRKMLRMMGKIIEQHQKKPVGDSQRQVGRNEQRPTRQGKSSTSGPRPPGLQVATHTDGNKTTESKDRSVELRGIPKGILTERKQAEVSLKCGKGNQTWYECCTKSPVTVRVVGVQRGPSRKRSREDTTSQRAFKKGKVTMMQVSPIGTTATLEERIMMPVDEDSGLEIYQGVGICKQRKKICQKKICQKKIC